MDAALALLVLVAAVVLAVLGWAGWRRFPLRIGLGYFFRRKAQVAIVVSGLLIGTAIISSSFVIQSTFGYTIRSAVFRTMDHADVLVDLPAPGGGLAPFPERIAADLRANLSAMPHVDGIAARYHLPGAAFDDRSGLLEVQATVLGFDPAADLGGFIRRDGSAWDGSGLAANEAIVNEKLARGVEAEEGDLLVLNVVGPAGPGMLPATIRTIVQDEGRAAWGDGANAFVRLDALQAALGTPGQVNLILVSNAGGVSDGYLVSDDAVAEVEDHLPPSPDLRVRPVKADSVEQAEEGVGQLSQLFTLLGTFTIIAGILLIVNIFVMLAEERKGEMGVARALGMRRKNLVQSFVSEGLLYALLSAAVGTLAGLLVAGVILWGFEQVFPAEFLAGVRFVLTWTWSDLAQGFAIGFLITIVTIVLASFRISKLNIVRAIRDIPEPVPRRSTKRQIGIGAGLAAVGAVAALAAFAREDVLLQDLGPALLALGLAILTMRILSPRIVFTAAGAFIVVWMLSPWKPIRITTAGIDLFIQAGMLLVLGGLLIVLFNSEIVLGLFTRTFRTRMWRPVVRTAIAYPMNKKFRTGATLASIALVMFTIATMSGIQAMVESSIETTTLRESGGFDLLGTTALGIPDWDGALANYSGRDDLTEARVLSTTRVQVTLPSGAIRNRTLLGVPSTWAVPSLPLQATDPAYPDAAAVWTAVHADAGLAVIDGTAVIGPGFGPSFGNFPAKVGDVLDLQVGSRVHAVRVIGILYEQFVEGIFVTWTAARDAFGTDAASLFYFKVRPGLDPTPVGHGLERAFVAYRMITLDIQAFVDQILEVTMGVFNLLQAYLALGLIVGIAGLGVITMRNVVVRRQETGALRALGFRKSMVLRSFLFELSFIALTGIGMGTVLGIAITFDLYLNFFEAQGDFVVPWARLVLLGGIAFFGSVLATASPAIRAARMPPAEALRAYE